MSFLRPLIVALAIACVATAAAAFQEQRQGAPSTSAAPAAELGVPQAAEPRSAVGQGSTDVRIPGLGKLGQLPRMDFGLELLYGAAEGKPSAPVAPRDEVRDDDLTIRGTVRHKF